MHTMLGNHRLIVDEWAEVYDLLRPYADQTFWNWGDLDHDPDAIYVIGRVQLKQHWQHITSFARGNVVFCNPAEGSETIKLQMQRLRITDLVKSGRMRMITSGSLEPGFHELGVDCYFTNIVEYHENLDAHGHWNQVYEKSQKPHSFLMLNGRLRPHRKYLVDALRDCGVLQQALWTNLGSRVELAFTSSLVTPELEQIRLLPPQYEIERARDKLTAVAADSGFVKHQLFNNTWGDAIVNPLPYIDSYFSLVTETIFDYPHSFRTEKIWKPMIMCHPFVVAANAGYYRDLKAVGFRTFGHLIDESFDQIENAQDRANQIVAVVQDICYNGAWEFLSACRDTCEYNYQRLQEYNRQERKQLPNKLKEYLDECVEFTGKQKCL